MPRQRGRTGRRSLQVACAFCRICTLAAPDFAKRRVFVDEQSRPVLARTPTEWARACARAVMLLAEDRAVATVFVVLTPSEPGSRNSLEACLIGGYLCMPEMFVAPPGAGLSLQAAA